MDFNPFLNKLITERNSAVVEDPLVDLLAEMVKAIVRLEAQQETPASETSSAPTTGPAERRWEWRSVTPDVPTASLEEAQGSFRLTVETTDCSKSMQFTPAELEAISWLFLTLPPTSELHTISGSTKDGARGVAAPDSPASSSEPAAQGGSEEAQWEIGYSDTGLRIVTAEGVPLDPEEIIAERRTLKAEIQELETRLAHWETPDKGNFERAAQEVTPDER